MFRRNNFQFKLCKDDDSPNEMENRLELEWTEAQAQRLKLNGSGTKARGQKHRLLGRGSEGWSQKPRGNSHYEALVPFG